MSFLHRYPKIDLKGAVVAITGGARGIGRATAQRFAAQGAFVAIGDLDFELAQRTATEIGGRAFQLDVGSRVSFAAFVAGIESALGPIDILVNNAGVMPLAPFLDEPDNVTATQLHVNLWGPINGMREVLPGMIERRCGHIVNIASLAGKTPTPGGAVYSATKHAVVGLSASVRDEVAEYGVSVSTILPSLVKTDLGAGLKMPSAVTVEPEEIAEAILDSLRHRRGETVIPRWLGSTIDVANLLPGSVQETARRWIGAGDVGTEANASSARAEYLNRVRKQAEGK